MFLYINDEVIELKNDSEKSKEYLNLINSKLNHFNIELGYLIVDGAIINDSYEEYLREHMSEIKKIEVISDTLKSLVNNTINSAADYISRAISQILSLGNDFYATSDEKNWSALADLFEGIQWIVAMTEKIDGIGNLDVILVNYGIWNEYVKVVSILLNKLPDLNDAMENRDNVLIGDVLTYEIAPDFETALGKLNLLSEAEGENYVS